MTTSTAMVQWDARRFQIGSDHHSYIYTENPDFADPWNGSSVFQCCRDVDSANSGTNRLYLYKDQDELWVAVSAPLHSEDPIGEGRPVFRTLTRCDPTIPGTYRWQQWEGTAWKWDMSFDTKSL